MRIYKKLKDYIDSRHINVQELANKLDYDKESFYLQLAGEYELDTESLGDICRALNVRATMFYE